MKKLTISLSLFCILLIACTGKKDRLHTTAPVMFRQSPLDSVYKNLRPVIQTFSINNNRANTIKAAKGTEILVPSRSFDTDGEVQVEVVEAFSMQDFITAGLATRSGGELLLSNGMIFINARANGEAVSLKEGASLQVNMPTMQNSNGYQMFYGDGSNWVVDSSMTETSYEIPLPLNLLYPEGNKNLYYCISYVGDPNEKTWFYDTTIVNLTRSEYENTVIATEAFGRRYVSLFGMMHWMSLFVNRDYYFDKTQCEDQKFNYDIFKVYYQHPLRPFRESDSIARQLYISYFNTHKKEMAAFCEEVNIHKRKYYNNWSDTNYYFDFRKTTLEETFMAALKNFPPPGDGEIYIPDNHGVNPEAADAFDQLKAKGVGEKEINELLTWHFRRKAIIARLQVRKTNIENKTKISEMMENTVFSVTRLGWINCDLFFDDPNAGPAEIYVTNASATPVSYIDYSLVIPDMNVRLSAFPDTKGGWSFTTKEGMYTKLPIGRNAVITGVSLQHDSVFFASRKIVIKDKLNIPLPMKYIAAGSLKDSLAAVLTKN